MFLALFFLFAVYQRCDAFFCIVYYSIIITDMVLTSAVSDTQESFLQTLNLVEELQVRWKNVKYIRKEKNILDEKRKLWKIY